MTKKPLSLGPEGLVSLSTRVQANAHRLGVRIPDNRLNSTASIVGDVKRNRDGFQSQTTQDFPFRDSVPCVATDTAVGGLCALTTSAEAIVPGSITEGSRAIWALDKVRVYDGGPAGDGANGSLFATQGYFVP